MKFIQRSSYTDKIDDVEKLGRVKLSSILKNLNPVLLDGILRVGGTTLLWFEVPDDTSQDSSRGKLIAFTLRQPMLVRS